MGEKRKIYLFSHGGLSFKDGTLYLENEDNVETFLADRIDEIYIRGN